MTIDIRSFLVPVVTTVVFGMATACLAATHTDNNATATTQVFYDNLKALQAANATAFGAQSTTWEGLNANESPWTGDVDRSDIKTVTGFYPAVTGWNIDKYFDLPETATPPALDKADFRQRVTSDFNRNTIITFYWPMNNVITGGSDRDLTGVDATPDATPSILVRAITTGDAANTRLNGYLDDFATLLGQLDQSDGTPMPIIFRPFHEMNTVDVFWWAAGDPGEFRALWQYVSNYLKDKGIHQLLYAYAPLRANSTSAYEKYWPGDAYVDICGVDQYSADWNASFEVVSDFASSRDMVAAYTEIGHVGGISPTKLVPADPTWWTSNILVAFNQASNPLWTKCAYMMAWSNLTSTNYHLPFYYDHPHGPDLRAFVGDPHVLLQPDLPPMYAAAPQPATVTLGNLNQTYNGSPRTITVTTVPAGLSNAVTYNGSGTAPTNAGSYAVVATVTDPGYTGTASGTLAIAKAAATLTLGGLTHTYDGTPKSATATTSPAGLSVIFTYNGSSTPPSAVGSYTVVGTINDTNYAGSASGTMTINAAPTTVTFYSVSAQDGWILESGETTNVGSTKSATATTPSALRTGDDVANKQYKAVVSFDSSSLPDGATITAVTLRLKRGTLVASHNPFTTHGACVVDVAGSSGFGADVALARADFENAASVSQVATMSDPVSDGNWSSGSLTGANLSQINKTGYTQLRVYFVTGDNDDTANDYIGWYSGEAAAGNQPELVVTYQ